MITQIGPHKVRCGSVMDGIDGLMGSEKADIIYSDPPWGQGNLNYWQTINSRQTGAPRQTINFTNFLVKVFSIFDKYAAGPVVLEYGERWQNEIINLAANRKFRIEFIGKSRYLAGHALLPLDIYVMSKTPVEIPPGYKEQLEVLRGGALVQFATAPFVKYGGIILDPMCGQGYTAQAALHHGMVFRGNEINQARLDKTIARLQRGTR